MPSEPVRLYADDDVRTPRTIASVLRKHRSELMGQLASGSQPDFAAVRYVQGQILAVNLALDICAEVEQELHGK